MTSRLLPRLLVAGAASAVAVCGALAVTTSASAVEPTPDPASSEAGPVAPAAVKAQLDSVDREARTAALSGSGQPGAVVTATTSAGEATTTVDADGRWSVVVAVSADRLTNVTVTQTFACSDTSATDVTVIVDPLQIPLAHPALAGGAALVAVSGFGVLALHRRAKRQGAAS